MSRFFIPTRPSKRAYDADELDETDDQ